MPLDVLEEYPTLAEWVEGLADGLLVQEDSDQDDVVGPLYVSRLKVRMPIEVLVRLADEEQGSLSLRVAPPSQSVETSVMPVLHGFEVGIAADHEPGT
jgi:hypothetical protein